MSRTDDLLEQCDAAFIRLADNYRKLGLRAFLVRDQMDPDLVMPAVLGPVDEDTPDVVRKAAGTVERYLRGRRH